MNAIALRQDFEVFAAPAPALAAPTVEAGGDVGQFVKGIVDQFEAEIRASRETMGAGFMSGAEKIDAALASGLSEPARAEVVEALADAIAKIERSMRAFALPFSDPRWKFYNVIEQVFRSVPAGTRRYLRKQFNRAEDLRVEQHNFAVDTYYALLALRSKVEGREEQDARTFTSGADLRAFLEAEDA